jgi:hypothetical protein
VPESSIQAQDEPADPLQKSADKKCYHRPDGVDARQLRAVQKPNYREYDEEDGADNLDDAGHTREDAREGEIFHWLPSLLLIPQLSVPDSVFSLSAVLLKGGG